jgi:hypothetical protein
MHMADPPSYPDTNNNDNGGGSGRESTTRAPRWAKVFGIVFIVVVLLLVIMLLTGHGPGRHMHSGGLGGHTPPSSVTEQQS